jgi:hypothetical protein
MSARTRKDALKKSISFGVIGGAGTAFGLLGAAGTCCAQADPLKGTMANAKGLTRQIARMT